MDNLFILNTVFGCCYYLYDRYIKDIDITGRDGVYNETIAGLLEYLSDSAHGKLESLFMSVPRDVVEKEYTRPMMIHGYGDSTLIPVIYDDEGIDTEMEILVQTPIYVEPFAIYKKKRSFKHLYATPLYVLTGLDVLSRVVEKFMASMEQGSFSYTEENHHNDIFHMFSHAEYTFALFVNRINTKSPFRIVEENGRLSQIYILTSHKATEMLFLEELFDVLAESRLILQRENTPYDLLELSGVNQISSMDLSSIDLITDDVSFIRAVSHLPKLNCIVGQDICHGIAKDEAIFWIERNRLPSVIFSRLFINTVYSSTPLNNENTVAALFIIGPSDEQIHCLIEIDNLQRFITPLKSQIPPALITPTQFEFNIGSFRITQQIYYFGTPKTIVFSNLAMFPTGNAHGLILDTFQTVKTRYIINTVTDFVGVKFKGKKIIATLDDISLVQLSFKYLNLFVFVATGDESIKTVETLNYLTKFLFKCKNTLIKNNENLLINILYLYDLLRDLDAETTSDETQDDL